MKQRPRIYYSENPIGPDQSDDVQTGLPAIGPSEDPAGPPPDPNIDTGHEDGDLWSRRSSQNAGVCRITRCTLHLRQ